MVPCRSMDYELPFSWENEAAMSAVFITNRLEMGDAKESGCWFTASYQVSNAGSNPY